MYRLVLLLAIMATACGDNAAVPKDDAGIDAAISACLDRPTEMARAPSGQLPCELLPPGFHP